MKARQLPEAALLAKHMSVWVDVWVDERFVKAVPVGFDVSAYGLGYVAEYAAMPGSALDQVALQAREVELTALTTKSSMLDMSRASGTALRLRRPVGAGEVVTRDHVEPLPAVSRGEWATLHAVTGLVDLESRVEVLEDGRTGQMVRVKLPNATASMLARVTGARMVEVRQ
ncbi:flagellar basal body P-ring formation chaperone FlgA [Cupriavidus sp. 8B]